MELHPATAPRENSRDSCLARNLRLDIESNNSGQGANKLQEFASVEDYTPPFAHDPPATLCGISSAVFGRLGRGGTRALWSVLREPSVNSSKGSLAPEGPLQRLVRHHPGVIHAYLTRYHLFFDTLLRGVKG